MNNILLQTSNYCTKLLTDSIPDEYEYHNLAHTMEVVESVEEIGVNSGLTKDEMEIVLIAAWFHDVGFCVAYEDHEENSMKLAEEFLTKQNYDPKQIQQINECIAVTKLGNTPENLMQKVIMDADMLHLGKKGFSKKEAALRNEWEAVLGKNYSEVEWVRQNIDFIGSHGFYTDYANEKYETRRQKNIKKLQKKLRQAVDETVNEQKEVITHKGIEVVKQPKMKRPDRGVETVFRITSRNHISLSSIADSKANMMISVNAIIISILISTLVNKLAEYQYLIIPTVILISVSLTTIIFAVLSTRPKVTKGEVSLADIERGKGNLLFFGNFFKMSLEDYEFGMMKLMNDAEYLYNSMTRDVYFLGIVLEQKYRFLRICYDIFAIGLVVSVVAFIIAFTVN